MSTLVLFNFFSSLEQFLYSYVIYIILGAALLSIVILFFYRLRNQEENVDSNLNSQYEKVPKKGIDINLKMQAYERLTIFLERTDPVRLLNSIDKTEKNIENIEFNILKILLSEFEYNISQQVYVSDTLWHMIIVSKNKTINLVSSVKNSLKRNANGSDFFNAFKLVLENQETTPSKIALNYLKKEVRSI